MRLRMPTTAYEVPSRARHANHASVWECVANESKTRPSKAPVLVIPVRPHILHVCREQPEKLTSNAMFVKSQDDAHLNNVLNRVVPLALSRFGSLPQRMFPGSRPIMNSSSMSYAQSGAASPEALRMLN